MQHTFLCPHFKERKYINFFFGLNKIFEKMYKIIAKNENVKVCLVYLVHILYTYLKRVYISNNIYINTIKLL